MHPLLSAFRQFRKSPAFTITVVLTIALGIGANTAIFTLVHAVLLRSLPVKNPKMLYSIGSDAAHAGMADGLPGNGRFTLFSYDLYRHFEETTPEFEQIAAMQSGPEQMNVRYGEQQGKMQVTEYVSGNYFATLGIGSFAGRLLTAQDDAASAAPAAVMSYATWQANYGSDPSVVGKTFTFENHPITVIGIAPAGFFGDRVSATPPAFWLPLAEEPMLEGTGTALHSATTSWLYLLGRIRPGVNTKALATQMTANLRNWLSTQPHYEQNDGRVLIAKQRIELAPGGGGIQEMQQDEGTGLYLLLAISALVLLVACANVANLLLARGSAHRADTSLRMALGASRGRIVKQMLTESVLLSCMGGIAGLALAYVGTRTILSLAFPDAPLLPIHANPSLAVLGFAFLLSLGTGVVFGVVPAWITSHADPAEALRGANRATRDRVSLPQRSLVVFQAALSLVLLVGAGLLTRTLAHLQDQKFGIQTADRYVVHIDPASAGYTVETMPVLDRALEERFGALPGVENLGIALYSPLEQTEWQTGIAIEGRPTLSAADRKFADYDRVSPQYFAAVGEPLLRGRVISDNDTPTSQRVAVINEAFAKEFFPGQNPLGQFFSGDRGRSNAFEIVGVVADAKYVSPEAKPYPMYFLPLTQRGVGLTAQQAASESRGMFVGTLVLQFRMPPANVDEMVRNTLSEINPNLTAASVRTFDYQVQANFTENRLLSRLAMLFGLLALVLAAVGLYGITAYRVARRTNEIGLRMALGATRGDVLRMVLRGAFMQVALGMAIGVPVAILGARSIESQLYGVNAFDPPSLGIAIVALSVAAVVAALIPARHAASVEPLRALRVE